MMPLAKVIPLYPCACCSGPTSGQWFDVCKNCDWESDPWCDESPKDYSGLNHWTLDEYRKQWDTNNEPPERVDICEEFRDLYWDY
jgi:hypothetical protein